MLTVLLVAGLVLLAWPLAAIASRPANNGTRSRGDGRRARYVARNPHEVNSADIRRMLSAGGLDDEQVEFVTRRAAELGINPFTMLVWLKRFDAQALATVVAADLSQYALIAHISNGTVPDLDELGLFSELNGYVAVKMPQQTRSRRHSKRTRTSTPAEHLPDIASPESWAMENGIPVTLETMGFYNLLTNADDDQNDADRHVA